MGKRNETAYEAYRRLVDRSIEKAGGIGPFGTGEVEEWRPAPRLLKFEVSSLGRVRDLAGRIRSLHTDHAGYKKVAYCGRCSLVHRLVLEAFVGPCPPRHEGAHYDGDPSNNRLDNLRWAMSKENSAYQFRHGTMQHGSRNGRAKLDEEMVVEMRRIYRNGGATQAQLAEQFSVSPYAAMAAITGKKWQRVEAPVPVGANKIVNAVRGERHHLAKLTVGDVAEMRGLHKTGDYTKRALSERFGIHYNTCRMALSGATWKHV